MVEVIKKLKFNNEEFIEGDIIRIRIGDEIRSGRANMIFAYANQEEHIGRIVEIANDYINLDVSKPCESKIIKIYIGYGIMFIEKQNKSL